MSEYDVSIRLTADDQASKTFADLKKNVESAAKSTKEIDKGMQSLKKTPKFEAADQLKEMVKFAEQLDERMKQVKIAEEEAAKAAKRLSEKEKEIAKHASHAGDQAEKLRATLKKTAQIVGGAFALHKLKKSFTDTIGLATDLQGQVRAIASFYVTGENLQWGDAIKQAKNDNAELYKSSIGIGQSIGDARESFRTLALQSDGTADGMHAALDETKKLLLFSDITGQSVTKIANQWGMAKLGLINTRSQLFKMLYTTGIFGKDVLKARTNWGNLADTERLHRLSRALDKINSRMADAPQTFASVSAGFQNIWIRLKELTGMEMLKPLTEMTNLMLKKLEAYRGKIEKLALLFGKFVGTQLRKGMLLLFQKMNYVANHWETITVKLISWVKALEKVIAFMFKHKILIGGLIATKYLAGLGVSVTTVTQQLGMFGGAIMGVKGKFTSAMAALASSGISTSEALLTAAASAASFAAAAGAIYLVVDQYNKLQNLGGVESAYNYAKYGRNNFYSAKDVSAIGDAAERLGRSNSISEEIDFLSEQVVKAKAKAEKTLKEQLKRRQIALDHAGPGSPLVGKLVGNLDINKRRKEIYKDQGIDKLIQREKELRAQYTAGLRQRDLIPLVASERSGIKGLHQAFMNGTDQSIRFQIERTANWGRGQGYESVRSAAPSWMTPHKFYKLIKDANNADRLYFRPWERQLKRRELDDKVVDPNKTTLNLNGGQTFNIKQDFRDQDPDRIALVFRDDIAKSASHRIRSQVRTAFGI